MVVEGEDELIARLQEGIILVRQQGMAIRPRILADYSSGRTDRVVVEWEAHSVEEIYALEGEIGRLADGLGELTDLARDEIGLPGASEDSAHLPPELTAFEAESIICEPGADRVARLCETRAQIEAVHDH